MPSKNLLSKYSQPRFDCHNRSHLTQGSHRQRVRREEFFGVIGHRFGTDLVATSCSSILMKPVFEVLPVHRVDEFSDSDRFEGLLGPMPFLWIGSLRQSEFVNRKRWNRGIRRIYGTASMPMCFVILVARLGTNPISRPVTNIFPRSNPCPVCQEAQNLRS